MFKINIKLILLCHLVLNYDLQTNIYYCSNFALNFTLKLNTNDILLCTDICLFNCVHRQAVEAKDKDNKAAIEDTNAEKNVNQSTEFPPFLTLDKAFHAS